jgi:hypothetical protein
LFCVDLQNLQEYKCQSLNSQSGIQALEWLTASNAIVALQADGTVTLLDINLQQKFVLDPETMPNGAKRTLFVDNHTAWVCQTGETLFDLSIRPDGDVIVKKYKSMGVSLDRASATVSLF